MLYTDDAGLRLEITRRTNLNDDFIAGMFAAFGLTVSKKKAETMLIRVPENCENRRGLHHHLPRIWSLNQRVRRTNRCASSDIWAAS